MITFVRILILLMIFPSILFAVVDNMTLDEKIGAMILVGYTERDAFSDLVTLIEDYHVSGLMIYGRNIPDAATLEERNARFRALAPNRALFLALDQEGGKVQRLKRGVYRLPSARTIGASASEYFAYAMGWTAAYDVRKAGFNLNFAPVADVDSNPKNPVIGSRSFSSAPRQVAEMAVSFYRGLDDAGVLSCAKHFPGHGNTYVDSHLALPVQNSSLDELNEVELPPFRALVDAGIPMVMMSHVMFPRLDATYPSSLSRHIIQDILRKDLGFGGVVITDDLLMGAISRKYAIGDAAVLAVEAGVDVLLFTGGLSAAKAVRAALYGAIENGRLSEARLDESIRRIQALHERGSETATMLHLHSRVSNNE